MIHLGFVIMNIFVCVKQVPDTASKIQIAADQKSIVTQGLSYVMSPYDEYGLEEALRMKESLSGNAEVTLVTIGLERATETLRAGMAMGADSAIHVKLDHPLLGSSGILPYEGALQNLILAELLAKVLTKHPFDLIFCGKQSVDDGSGQVGPMLAEKLGIPYSTFVVEPKLVGDKKLEFHREVEGGIVEIYEAELPILLTAEKGPHEPRYASLPGIMKAKQKPITQYTLTDLSLTQQEIEEMGKQIELVALEYPPQRKQGKVIEGTPEEAVKELVRLLHEEAKVI